MHPGYVLYNVMLPAARAIARFAALYNDKIAEGLAGRKGLEERWHRKAAGLDRGKQLVWFHVSSVGEFEQAKPVMNLLAERHGKDLQIALTFYSPSGMNYYERFDRSKRIDAVVFVDYLPVDTRRNMRFCLDILRPDAIVYVKFDLWPNLIVEAERRGIQQVLVSGTLSPGSRRLSWLARGFYADVYSRLDAIAAISDEDAERFRQGFDIPQPPGEGGSGGNGPKPPTIGASRVPEIVSAGDTRFDQVCRRIDSSTVSLPSTLRDCPKRFLIAGSTWPRDEEIVIPGFARLMKKFPDAGLIVVPHEPTPQRLGEIDTSLILEGIPYTLLSVIGDEGHLDTPAVVADGIGYLAELYRTGYCAYVGGSFTTGVHNVMEPAVLELPVFFGPRIDNSYEARKLVELGVGRIVTSAREFADAAGMIFADAELRDELGRSGARFIRNHCGAAIHCVDLIETHLKHHPHRSEMP
jgi:3-deoxy-D-manno-octulosonic-acid transferase